MARSAVKVADLRNETVLMVPRRDHPDRHDTIIAACGQAGFPPRAIETTFGYIDQIGLVGAGYGIALIPGAVATISSAGVVYRPVARPTIALPYVDRLECQHAQPVDQHVASGTTHMVRRIGRERCRLSLRPGCSTSM